MPRMAAPGGRLFPDRTEPAVRWTSWPARSHAGANSGPATSSADSRSVTTTTSVHDGRPRRLDPPSPPRLASRG